MKRAKEQPISAVTSQFVTPRERITPKDIMLIMGFEKNKAYRFYNQIRATKSGVQAEIVGVDDLAAATGFKRDTIKASMI